MALVFQCSLREPDAQDIAAGMDTCCLVLADQAAAYRVVAEVTLRAGVLGLRASALVDVVGLVDRHASGPHSERCGHEPGSRLVTGSVRRVLPSKSGPCLKDQVVAGTMKS